MKKTTVEFLKLLSNQYFSAALRITFLGLLTTAILLFVPFLDKNLTTYAEPGEGSWCNAAGHVGTCWDRASRACATYYDSGNYCPGDNSVQCCVNSQVSCRSGTGVCHNRYSGGFGNVYACGGTWYSGYCPGPTDVQCCVAPPPTATPTRTPTPTPIGPCGDPSGPSGSSLSTGVSTSASSVYQNNNATYGPANVVDAILDPSRFWRANAGAPQWIELDLGAPQTVTGVKLYVRQSPNGVTGHQVRTGASPAPTTNRRTLSCYTRDNQVINVVFSTPLTNTRYVRIYTTSSVSWIGWSEITVFGSAPGAQTNSPGIIYSGDASVEFGNVGGRASVEDWVVGGLIYPEVFQTSVNPSTTAYDYMFDKIDHAGIAMTNMTTLTGCASLANCTLPANLPNGVYIASGNVNLNTYAFPTDRNYVFLIDGDLTIRGNIIVPNGSTAFFSSSNDIVVDRNVGTNLNLFPLPSGQVQGIFSADRDFTVDGINSCTTGTDKMLNVEGSIVTNAAGNGGHFRTRRDLCGDNPNVPSFTVRLRLDFILNAPVVLARQRTILREEAP